MPDLKITQLPTVTTLSGSDVTAWVKGGVTSKITLTNLATVFAGLIPAKSLAATLAIGNTTGGNNIVISNLDFITTPTGLLQMDFSGAGGDSLAISTDSGTYSEASLFLIPASASLYYNLQGLTISSANANISHATMILFSSPIYRFSTLTASTVPYLNASKNLVSSTITPTELGYLSGASSNIQNQINNINAGLSWKLSMRAATVTTLPAYTATATVITASSNGALAAQDGVTLILNDRLLVKNETGGNQKYNGLYYVSQVGTGGTPYILTRTTDAVSGTKGATGILQATTSIEEGSVNADTIYLCTTDAPITVGTTALTFAKTSATTYTSSAGITLTGNDFTLDNSYFSGAFTLSGGVATLAIVSGAKGGTGIANTGLTITLGGNLITTGAFNTTFAASATATYTLPTATSTLLANTLGIAGGTILIGGTATTDKLTFRTTSNAGGTTGADFIWQSGNNGATELMRLLNNGRLGIGTAAPGAQLEVNKSQDDTTTVFTLNPGTGTFSSSAYRMGEDNSSKYISINYYNNSWSGGANTALMSNSGALASPSGATNGMLICAVAGDIRFCMGGFVTATNEKMRLLSTGALIVGGTTIVNTGALISVQKNQNAATVFEVTNTTAGANAYTAAILNSDVAIAQYGLYGSTKTAYGAIASNNAFNYTSAPGLTIAVDNAAGVIKFATGTSVPEIWRMDAVGRFTNTGTGVGWLTLKAGTTSIPSILLTSSGTGLTGLLTVPLSGALEFTTYGLWVTKTTAVRHMVWSGLDAQTAPATNSIGVILDYYGTSATRVLTTPDEWISVTTPSGNVRKIPAYA